MSDKPKIKPWQDVVAELQFENEALHAEVERLRKKLVEAQAAIHWLWGFWDGNTLIASPSADREALDEAWNRLLKVLGDGNE